MSAPLRIGFIDWLKAFGIIVILLGHLAGGYTNFLAPPIYPKQLGVAFFIFAAAYTLALEERRTSEVIFNRLFEVFLWGISVAVIVSVLSLASGGGAALSNYLPFLLGANVVINHFPANPTSWYIGTYIDLLLLWALLRRFRISTTVVAAAAVLEICCRSLLSQVAGLHIAYMLLPNWSVVFLAGLVAGRLRWSPQAQTLVQVGSLVVGVAWYFAVWPFVSELTVPFMLMEVTNRQIAFLATSTLVTVLYFGWTLVVCWSVGSTCPPAWVRFLARNTLLVFLAHMPVFYVIEPHLRAAGFEYPMRSAIELAVCLPGLAAISELGHRVMAVREWRSSWYRRLLA